MRKYLSFFRLRFSMGLQYRAAALAGVATQFAWGFLEIMAFRAFYRADAAAFPMTFEATVSYVWMQQAFLAFFAVWTIDNEIFDAITDGNIAYELCRPIRIYNMWFARNMAKRVSSALLRCFPILIVAVFLPKPYGLEAPASPIHLGLFLITLILGMLVTVAMCMVIYVLAFFTISPQGLRIVFVSLYDFFSGAVIPLPFFPQKLQMVMELSPFAAMQNVALRIYSGSMTRLQMQKAILLQIFWLIVLVLVGTLLCRYAEKRVSVQGG